MLAQQMRRKRMPMTRANHLSKKERDRALLVAMVERHPDAAWTAAAREAALAIVVPRNMLFCRIMCGAAFPEQPLAQ